MIAFTLYWKHNGEDVRLGNGFHERVPPDGALLTFVCDHGVGWRVVTQQYHLIMEGSQVHMAWRDGRSCDPPAVDLFVEPAEGPFEP